jgi:hypothetical protein
MFAALMIVVGGFFAFVVSSLGFLVLLCNLIRIAR